MTGRMNGEYALLAPAKLLRVLCKAFTAIGNIRVFSLNRIPKNIRVVAWQDLARASPQIVIMVLLDARAAIQFTPTGFTVRMAFQNTLTKKAVTQTAFGKQSPMMIYGSADLRYMAFDHAGTSEFPAPWYQIVWDLFETLEFCQIRIWPHDVRIQLIARPLPIAVQNAGFETTFNANSIIGRSPYNPVAPKCADIQRDRVQPHPNNRDWPPQRRAEPKLRLDPSLNHSV